MAGPAERLGPIQLRASIHETIWGGRNLATVAGKALPGAARIGETWETELSCRAANPPFAGQTLGELTARYGERLIGTRAHDVLGPRFPLLAKFLDAQEQLSVQVHPDDAYAAAHEGGKLGKTEAWYILHAAPGARVIAGLRRAASEEEVRAAIARNVLEDLLRVEEVRAGDVIFVPAGTVHAICTGVVLYELQEYSDLTYRLYDYGRLQPDGQPRALHIEQGLSVMRYTPAPAVRVRPVTLAETSGCHHRALVGCRYFLLEEVALQGRLAGRTDPSSCQIVTLLDGDCAIHAEAGSVHLQRGETAVLPAALGSYTLSSERARLVRSFVPRENDAALIAWQAAQLVPVLE
ncbi:MAG TPA: type I phosphomannose isomerase catalytic subunit [Ktedonobacterales bacterium]